MFEKLSTSLKLWGLGGSAVVTILLIGAVGIVSIKGMSEQTRSTLDSALMANRVMVVLKSAQSSFLVEIQEWKNILIRGNDPGAFEKHLAAFQAGSVKTQAYLTEAGNLVRQNGEKADSIEALQRTHAELNGRYLNAIKAFKPGDPEAGKLVDKQVRGIDRETVQGMEKLVTQMETAFRERSDAQIALQARQSVFAERVFLGVSLVGIGLIVVLFVVIRRDLMGRLGGEPAYAAEVVHGIAGGNLALTVVVQQGGEQSLLASIQQMQKRLHEVIRQVTHVAQSLMTASHALVGISQQVADRTVQQGQSSAAVAGSVGQMSVSIEQVAGNARNTHQLANQALELSATSSREVQCAVEEMNGLAESVQISAEVVNGLGQHSEKISGIADVIKEIASQTNLLALNAAIEAARAGEAGRGFAVVADEIRKLAEKTTASTREISEMLAAIQEGTRKAVLHMESGSEQVGRGVGTIQNMGISMSRIEQAASQVLEAVDEISAVLHEQNSAALEIRQNIGSIAETAEENDTAVKQVSAAAQELEALAASLERELAQFRL